ncbi:MULTISPECIES: hypothetical protein [Nostocales]|nr:MULTISPECIES: hypothetical protein [Nostocales]
MGKWLFAFQLVRLFLGIAIAIPKKAINKTYLQAFCAKHSQ